MIELVEINNLYVEIVDSYDLETLWKGYTTYEKLRNSLVKSCEKYYPEVDYELFPNKKDEGLYCEVHIMLAYYSTITVKDLLPEIIEGL